MKTFFRIIWKTFKVLAAATGILFVIYSWNLDQKLMEWAYRWVNELFDRKKEDLNF